MFCCSYPKEVYLDISSLVFTGLIWKEFIGLQCMYLTIPFTVSPENLVLPISLPAADLQLPHDTVQDGPLSPRSNILEGYRVLRLHFIEGIHSISGSLSTEIQPIISLCILSQSFLPDKLHPILFKHRAVSHT